MSDFGVVWAMLDVANFRELRYGEVRRILLLLRTLVNRLQGAASPKDSSPIHRLVFPFWA
jgi:hypothetical protein